MISRAMMAVFFGLSAGLFACSVSDSGESNADAQFGGGAASDASGGGQSGQDDGGSTADAGDDASVDGGEEPSDPTGCAATGVGTVCDDGDCCTTGDICQACNPDNDADCSSEGFVCVGSPACVDDDDNVCTVTSCTCDPDEMPVCAEGNAPDGDPCDFDSNDCTLGDTCLAGVCIKSDPLPLDDGNPCTEDACVKGELVHTALLEGQCDDGNECTTGDTCLQGTCTGGEAVVCAVGPCMADAECVPGEGCVESPLPVGAFCETDNPCIESAFCDASQACVVQDYKNCDDGNDCTVDTCDPAGGCVNAVSPTMEVVACSLDTESPCVAGGVCVAGDCVADPIVSCIDGDECCAEGCDSTTDSDCSASCGNGVVEGNEKCDGDCPSDCEGADPCQYGVLVGDPAACSAQCSFIQITQTIQGDGCCPPGASDLVDSDCQPLCGNGVLDEGELCDGTCPTACQSDGACGTPQLVGSAANCDAQCVDPITSCENGDGCCPDGCTADTDDDCAVVQPCHVYIDVECVDDPVFPVRYKIAVNATVGVMNYYWNPEPVDDPEPLSLIQGGWCWNSTGEGFIPFNEPAGCFDVIYDTITDESDCSVNGPAYSCDAQLCYDCN